MRLRQILAVIDFSSAGIHAAWRAARLAWAHEAGLHLLTRVPLPDRHPTSRHGASAPPVRARVDLDHLADEIADSIGIRPRVTVCMHGDAGAAWRRHAQGTDLVVVPGGTALPRDWRHGSAAERILRETGVPVLLARRPSGVVHRRVMAAIEPGIDNAEPLLRAARWFCRPEGLLACQVLDPLIGRHLQAADLAPQAVQAWTEVAAHRAETALRERLADAGLRAAQTQVLRGDALARLLHAQRGSDASLLVVGKPRRAWWADLLRPALARRLADRVACDVLWLPTPAPSAPLARERLGALRAASQ